MPVGVTDTSRRLQVERPSYEDWKRKQKEEQDKQDKLAGNEEKLMRGWPAF